MTILTLNVFFVVAGIILAAMAVQIARDAAHPARWGSAIFWGLLAVVMIAGKQLAPVAVGYAVTVMVVLAAAKQVGLPKHAEQAEEELENRSSVLGNRLLWPILLVPVVAVIGGYTLGEVKLGDVALADTRAVSGISLGLGCVLALVLAARTTREGPGVAVGEGGRLLQAISWTLILPQMLAGLGGIFAQAGVGEVIAQFVAWALPVQDPLVAVVAYCLGMALFTILLGNAFAAFPIMTLGVGVPFIMQAHGGNAAIMGALGMLSGYCGTLLTPMAANFNLVPVRLLELRDDWAVIKAQAPFAVAIWIFNVALMALCVYRF